MRGDDRVKDAVANECQHLDRCYHLVRSVSLSDVKIEITDGL